MRQFLSVAEWHEKRLSDCFDHPGMDCLKLNAISLLFNVACSCRESPNYVISMLGWKSAEHIKDVVFAACCSGVAVLCGQISQFKVAAAGAEHCFHVVIISQVVLVIQSLPRLQLSSCDKSLPVHFPSH